MLTEAGRLLSFPLTLAGFDGNLTGWMYNQKAPAFCRL
jgi:hypothetical protein